MATPTNLEIRNGDFVNEGKTKFNEAIKSLPISFSFDGGVLSLNLYGTTALTVDLSDHFPTRTEVATQVLPTAGSFAKPGLIQLGNVNDPIDLQSNSKVLPIRDVVKLIETYLQNNTGGDFDADSLLRLIKAASTATTTAKPNGDIPDINEVLFNGITPTNAVILAQKLLSIGFSGGSSGNDGSGTPWVIKSKRCFKRNLTNILDGSITNDHLGFSVVSFDKTEFLASGLELYNKASKQNKDGKVIDDKGVFSDNESYRVSHPIPVKPLRAYTSSVGGVGVKYYIAFFDKFDINLNGVTFNRADATFVVPADTAYIRCSIPLSQKDAFSLVEGDKILEKEDFYLVANVETETGDTALIESYKANSLLSLFGLGVNFINPNTITDNKFIDDNSVISDHATLCITDFIPVEPDTWYVTTDKQYIAFFNSKRKRHKGVSYDRSTEKFKTGKYTRYIRLTLDMSLKNTYQLQKGEVIITPVPFKPVLFVETPTGTLALENSQKALKFSDQMARFITVSNQLYDKDDTVNNVVGYYEDNFGNRRPDAGYVLSPFIPVEPNTWYTPSFRAFVSYYGADQIKLVEGALYNRVDAMGNDQKPFKTSAKTAFVRCSIPLAVRDTFMLVVGLIEKPFQLFGGKTTPYLQIGFKGAGKKLYVNGTSIDAQGKHHEGVAANLELLIVNKAVPGGSCRRANKDGSFTNNSIYAIGYNMSSTLAEKEDFITNYVSKYRVQLNDAVPLPTTLSNELKEYIRSTSYERSLVPYLDGTYSMPDLFLINHGINDVPFVGDVDADWTTVPSNPYDRNTYIGAMSYIFNVIYSYNPRAKIAIISHAEHGRYPRLVKGQQFLAELWGIPILRLDNLMACGQQRVPGTQHLRSVEPWKSHIENPGNAEEPGDEILDLTRLEYKIPDRLHYESDPTGETGREVIGHETPFVKQLLS